MLRNINNREVARNSANLLSVSVLFLTLTACGGGEGDSEANALGIQDISIAYIKRPTPRDNNGNIRANDMRQPAAFSQGGDLYVQSRASTSSSTTNVTKRITNELGDVRDVSVSYDGTKLIFSLRIQDPIPNDGIVPSWNLYEYDITNDTLTALISVGSQEDGDDISPKYLPDGRIIFASTRQTDSKGIRVNEGRGTFAAVDENRTNLAFSLHVLNADSTIKQVSFNQSNDLDPIVLKDNGRILFSRWNNMGSRNDVSLYSMNPDGTDVQLYYGAHSHRTGQNPNADVHFYKPREMEDGRIMSILRPLVTNFGGGSMILIDGKNFADNTQPIWSQQGFITGTAQTIFTQNLNTASGISLKGRYNASYPLLDGSNRFLMSWSPCQILINPTIPFDQNNPTANIIPCSLATSAQLTAANVTEAPPSYGIFLVDPGRNTQVPIVGSNANSFLNEVVMTYATRKPPIIFDKIPGISPELNQGFATEGVGILHIRSVYDFDNSFAAYNTNLPTLDNDSMPITIDTPEEMANPKNTTADQRPARFVRITKGVSVPDRTVIDINNTAYGVSTQQGMREIVGYAPVEPDGSVKIKVPSNVPLTISVLDKDGRRISNRHQYWFQVKPGETLECIGCHVHDTNNQAANMPHGRPDFLSSFNQGALTTGNGFPFSLSALWAEIGETMAETKARHSCLPSNPSPCSDMKPSVNLVYNDDWTDDVASNRSADSSFSIDYTGTPVSPAASTACVNNVYNNTTGSFTYCRVVINYQEHIQPIWEKARGVNTCTDCHTATGFAHLNAGQLELTSNPSDREANHFTSYQELLSPDDGQFDNMGLLENIEIDQVIVPNVDLNPMDGQPDTIRVPDPAFARSPTMSTAGARNSVFMELMTGTDLNNNGNQPTDTQNHNLMLTPSELKLISEWLDIGAQYFNNPLDPALPIN